MKGKRRKRKKRERKLRKEKEKKGKRRKIKEREGKVVTQRRTKANMGINGTKSGPKGGEGQTLTEVLSWEVRWIQIEIEKCHMALWNWCIWNFGSKKRRWGLNARVNGESPFTRAFNPHLLFCITIGDGRMI